MRGEIFQAWLGEQKNSSPYDEKGLDLYIAWAALLATS